MLIKDMDKYELYQKYRDYRTASAAWKAKSKQLKAQLEDVENEWDAERIRYQEQLKRVAELESTVNCVLRCQNDSPLEELWGWLTDALNK